MVVAAGDYLPGALIRSENKSNVDATIVKGNLLIVSAGNWTQSPAVAGQINPFAVAASTPATSDSTVAAIREGWVYLLAGGTIQPLQQVQNDPANAGRVVAFAATAVPTTPTGANVQTAVQDNQRIVGIYEGHENESSYNNSATACATGDVIRVKLGFGGQS